MRLILPKGTLDQENVRVDLKGLRPSWKGNGIIAEKSARKLEVLLLRL